MKTLFAALLLALSTSTFAVGIGNDNPPGNGGNTVQVANADSRARALSYSAALNRTEVTNNITPAATPVTLTVNNNEAKIPENTRNEQTGTLNVRNVPNVFSGNVYPTAPCMGSSTVGAAALGWGVSLGSSWTDDECGIRETARSFQNLELKGDAVSVLCTSKYAAAASVCKNQAQPKE